MTTGSDAWSVPDDVDEHGRTWKRCVDCTEPYFISKASAAACAAKGFTLPSRCFACRERRKLAREIADFEQAGPMSGTGPRKRPIDT
jgi:hypothetical protein